MGTQYYATVRAEVPQLVRCEHCDQEFLYLMRKTGTGMVEPFFDFNSAKAYQQAAELARQDLVTKLTVDNFNVVPCRHCFRYQSFMRERAARQKYGNNRYIGALIGCLALVVLAFGIFATLEGSKFRTAGIGLTAAGVALVLTGIAAHWGVRRLMATYDPNGQPEARRRVVADQRCQTWAEFYRTQEARLAREYQEHAGQEKRGVWLAKVENRVPPAPAQLWLPARVLMNGHTLSLSLAPGRDVAVEIAPDAEPGCVIEVVPGGRNEFSFRVVLMAIFDYYSDPRADEHERTGAP